MGNRPARKGRRGWQPFTGNARLASGAAPARPWRAPARRPSPLPLGSPLCSFTAGLGQAARQQPREGSAFYGARKGHIWRGGRAIFGQGSSCLEPNEGCFRSALAPWLRSDDGNGSLLGCWQNSAAPPGEGERRLPRERLSPSPGRREANHHHHRAGVPEPGPGSGGWAKLQCAAGAPLAGSRGLLRVRGASERVSVLSLACPSRAWPGSSVTQGFSCHLMVSAEARL